MFKKIAAALLLLFSSFISSGQDTSKAGIEWISFEQAVAKSKANPKKIFIDVYTNWCGWCRRMDASTFSDSLIVEYMNKNYYAVKLDAETKDTIHFQDTIFVYRPEYKANELAVSLLSQKMSYPTSIFLDDNFAMLSTVSGFQATQQMLPLLKFFGDNIYKTKSWDAYSKELDN
jgi:thioredoxin-related protein